MKIIETGNLFDYYKIKKYFIAYNNYIVGYINIYPAFIKVFIQKNLSKKLYEEINIFFFFSQKGNGYNGYNEYTFFFDKRKKTIKEIIHIFKLSSFSLIQPEYVNENKYKIK